MTSIEEDRKERQRAAHQRWISKPGNRERQRAKGRERYQAALKDRPGHLAQAAERATLWYRENRERVLSGHRLRKFGLTAEDYERMLAAQDHRCATCGRADTGRRDRERFAIDHCHTTGRIRGLLCNKCNTGIGLFCDDPDLLLKAAAYLQRNT